MNSKHSQSQKNREQTPEEYIQQVTIGDNPPHNSTIYLAPYNPSWPAQYAKLEKRIRHALGDRVLMLEHVGSTSVEGLSAKPIIDLILEVSDSADEESYVPQLESQEFVLHLREPDWHEHRLLKAIDIKANLHVFSDGCEEVARMLAFRNRLRSNSEDRIFYERTKRELAARTWKYTQHYADAKTEVVHEILNRAMDDSQS